MEFSSINASGDGSNALPDWNDVLIPPSAFIMGTDIEPFYGTIVAQSRHAKLDEAPIHVRFLEAYRIARYPVTNAEYEVFVNATGHTPPPHWEDGKAPADEATLPVVHVSWHDAIAYAQWAQGRLPIEGEWEKAARGADGRIYPWGNKFEPVANKGAAVLTDQLTPVGNRPGAVSPYGVHEVAGNVWEWTADWYRPYEGNTYRYSDYRAKHKVLRGGSWLEVRDETANRYFRCANRLHAPPDYTASNIGFRCVRDVVPAGSNPEAVGQEMPVYPTQISAELLNKYVRQERSKNLQRIRKRARGRCFGDCSIAALAIGVGSYGMMIPKYAIGGFTLAMIGIGFLFSAGVNFWRQWKARKFLDANKVEGLS
ncbi:formylglycine-generating enzyme family protein [Candidatus Poribacteria bacterium]|nr:formylglycine-generating enzyme family protein [Candidatus Poribacteria bacterium]